MRTLRQEWRYTYRSARRDGRSRVDAARRFLREVGKGWALLLGLNRRYDRHGRARG